MNPKYIMLPFPRPAQTIQNKSMIITDHELNPPLPTAKDSYLPFSLPPPTVFPLEGLHDLLNIQTRSTRVLLQDLHFPPYADTNGKSAAMARKNVSSKIRSSPSKRAGRTDRHSKICTAAGFRDRRMRLSLDVARKFFDLQDLLGFDKGSETVQWLLTNSRAAIDELTTASNGELHMSSELEDASPSVSDHAKGKSSTFEISSSTDDSMNKSKNKSSVKNKPKKKSSAKDKSKNTSSASKSQLQAKESRSQARARARERTREKKILMSSSLSEANRFGVAEEEDRQEDLKSLCFIDRDLSSKSHNKLASGSSTWLQLLNSATTTQQASMMQLACFKNNWA